MAKKRENNQRTKDILITGAIGDVISLSAFMSDEFRSKLRTIHWAAKRGNQLSALFPKLSGFEQVEHKVIFGDFGNRGAFMTKAEVAQAVVDDLSEVEDWSISTIFPRILAGELSYGSCPFIENKLADLGTIELPPEYIVIQPSSQQNSPIERGMRDLLPMEVDRVCDRLTSSRTYGVVLDLPGDTLPPCPWLVDRRGLSVAEGIEIVKDPRCKGYIGIDSWVSIVAAHRFDDPSKLLIRTKNHHYLRNQSIYSAPHKTFEHVVPLI